MDAHFGPWVWEIFVNIEYMYYIHWKTEQHTCIVLYYGDFSLRASTAVFLSVLF